MTQRYIVCAVRDRKAEVYGQPFCIPAIGLATRGFADQINREAPDNPLYHHPEDFDLYMLTYYVDETGSFDSGEEKVDLPRLLMRGLDARSALK